MPVQRISANQWAAVIRSGILGRDANFDVTDQEIVDICINPQARVLELQHDTSRKIALILTLSNPNEFEGEFEVDLDGIVFNEGLKRSLGSQATAVCVFSRSSAPSSDIRVQRGFPVATVPDEGSGQTVTFVTTEERTMFASTASSYFNIATQRYELSIPVVAVVEGSQGRVGATRVNRPLRPLVGFDSVTNTSAASGGRNRETTQRLIDRYLIAIIGRDITTSTGIRKVVIDDFPDVEDILTVSGTNALLTRAGEDAGAVDAYLIGSENIEQIESPNYLGAGQLIPISFAPLVEVISVQDLSTGTIFVEGTDYDVVFDVSGYAKSSRAQEGVRFRFTGSSPAIGNPVTITYAYNNLIRRLQVELKQDDTLVVGRDLLFKAGTEVPVVHTAQIRVHSRYSTTQVVAAAHAAVVQLINETNRKLGVALQGSDIQGVVRQITGVDNYIITRLTRATIPSGTADIDIASNEWASIADADLTITSIL